MTGMPKGLGGNYIDSKPALLLYFSGIGVEYKITVYLRLFPAISFFGYIGGN
jgi:hypothetical protein